MKKFLIPVVLLAAVLLGSCSGGGNTPVTAADRDKAMMAIFGAQTTASGGGGAGWTSSTLGDTTTLTGPNASATLVYAPSYATYLPNGSVTIALTMTGYVDAATGYSISGILTSVMTFVASSPSMITLGGTFTLTGGKVQTVTMNVTMNLTMGTYTGTMVVNGQTFVY